MNAYSKSLLLVTNGARENLPALAYGVWLADILKVPVTLLGIADRTQRKKALEDAIQQTQQQLDKLEIPHETQLEQGEVRQVIRRLVDVQKNLLILGPFGSPRWLRTLRGRKFRRILKDIDSPLLYVPSAQNRIANILVCMGGLGYASSVEEWAIYLARHTDASITILHVLEKVYYEYPTAIQIQEHGEQILSTDTPQAHNLSLALQRARQAGVPAELKTRQGDIIHEILAEIQVGQYDLVAMGSQKSSQSMRRYFTPNVTAEVAEAISIPVLSASAGQAVIFD